MALQPHAKTLYAGHQSLYFRSNSGGGFDPAGIDFNFRLSAPAAPNEARMLITRPLSGNPRELRQIDAEEAFQPSLADFVLRILLPSRPSNGDLADGIAAIPDVLSGTAAASNLTPNDILVSQGLMVYKISGAEPSSPYPLPGPPTATFVPITDFATSTCAPGNTGTSDLLVDRWAAPNSGFSGRAILTCQGSAGREIWLIAGTINPSVGTAIYWTTLTGVYSGRADLTSPNFTFEDPSNPGMFIVCGGCLALVADNNPMKITVVRGPQGGLVQTWTIPTGLTVTQGRRNVVTVPPRVYEFGTSTVHSGGCLFGTVPSANTIRKFPCSTDANGNPFVFGSTKNGDLLIFTPAQTVIRVSASGQATSCGSASAVVCQVDSNVGTYEDLAHPNLRVVFMQVHQPANANPNQGVQGHILFYIVSDCPSPTDCTTGFNPQTDVNISTVRFGGTGSEDSVMGNCVNVGTDLNGDGWGELKCSAVQSIALCDEVNTLCIATGFTYNQTAFDGW